METNILGRKTTLLKVSTPTQHFEGRYSQKC